MIDRYCRETRPTLLARVDVVPYIDVMLVLLAIFLLTAPFLQPAVVPVPALSQAQSLPPRLLRLTIRDRIHVTLHYGSVTALYTTETVIPVLKQQWAAAGPSSHVLLAADPHVPYGWVMHVLDLLQKAGIGDVGLMVRAEHLS